jgi:hypothetical protein
MANSRLHKGKAIQAALHGQTGQSQSDDETTVNARCFQKQSIFTVLGVPRQTAQDV